MTTTSRHTYHPAMAVRALLLFSVTPAGDGRFTGTMRWAGITVRGAEGQSLPAINVELRKRSSK